MKRTLSFLMQIRSTLTRILRASPSLELANLRSTHDKECRQETLHNAVTPEP